MAESARGHQEYTVEVSVVVPDPVSHRGLETQELQDGTAVSSTRILRASPGMKLPWGMDEMQIDYIIDLSILGTAHLGGNVDHVQSCKQAGRNHYALPIAGSRVRERPPAEDHVADGKRLHQHKPRRSLPAHLYIGCQAFVDVILTRNRSD